MSQASKQIDWCLSKAKNELEECARLKKRPKHRGLIKLEPNTQQAQNHLKKAEENLEFATCKLIEESYLYLSKFDKDKLIKM